MARKYTLHSTPAFQSGSGIDYAAELNEQQLAAVTAPPGPALVIAGAGSGKTRTLTYRVAYLLDNGVEPSNILLLTFTNKAAREMVGRVSELATGDSSQIWGGTFHSIGNRMLRRSAPLLGFRPGFSIMDRDDQEEMLDAVIGSAGVETRDARFPKAGVLSEIFSYSLNTGLPLEEVVADKYPYFVGVIPRMEEVWAKYEERKKGANSMDFDDLLAKSLQLLRENPALAEEYQRRFLYILVDEYQDTNHIQAEFIDFLAARHKSVMVVGDDAQSIYSWRGADFRNILEFPKRYPGAKIYKIAINYRSVPEVLEVANAAIAANARQFRKELTSAREVCGVKPAVVPLQDNNQQAAFVAQRVLELNEEGVDFDEIAILYRAHYHSMEVQLEFTRRGIPFQITSGLRFFEQAHVKDVAAFLKFVVNPNDEISFKRMAKLLPGVGAKTADSHWENVRRALEGFPSMTFREALEACKVSPKTKKSWTQLAHTLEELAPGRKPLPPSEMIGIVLEAVYDDYMKDKFPNYEQRREDLNTLISFSRQFGNSEEFLSQLALLSTADSETGRREATDDEVVTLSSIHQAKGLEWKAVFLIWMADGMFPGTRSLDNPNTLEEERRLFYVGVTRAKDELYMTYPNMRMNAGYGEMWQRPSRFLAEIPEELVESWDVGV
ncbi:MAG TPA: ATP-dependent helicase [Chthoniobacterales bacterium]